VLSYLPNLKNQHIMAWKSLTKGNIKSDPSAGSASDKWFFDGLKDFLDALRRYFDEHPEDGSFTENPDSSQINPKGENGPCLKCKLELFYYYHQNIPRWQGYQNAIWIKVHNINGIVVWLRVFSNINHLKNVHIYSECKLKCPEFPLAYYQNFGLPPTFHPHGIWREVYRVQNVNWATVIQWVCDRLPCACSATC